MCPITPKGVCFVSKESKLQYGIGVSKMLRIIALCYLFYVRLALLVVDSF